jgi:hypothetical protein
VRDTAAKVGISVLSAGVGIAGGIMAGRTTLQKKRKALGVPVSVPNKKIEFRGLAKQVGEAGRQFGQLAQEVRAVREKAEQIARIIG